MKDRGFSFRHGRRKSVKDAVHAATGPTLDCGRLNMQTGKCSLCFGMLQAFHKLSPSNQAEGMCDVANQQGCDNYKPKSV